MTNRKSDILKSFQALEAVLDESPAASSMQKTVNSLKTKLAKEKDTYLSRFSEREDRVMTPSMGMIEMVSEKTDEAQYYFGSPIKSRDRIRIRVYQASVNPKTEEIYPEEMVTDIIMTEKQFGDVLSQPGRGTGFPMTQLVRDGADVEPYDASRDPGKGDLKRLTDAIGEDHNFTDTIDEIRGALEEAKESGRMKKKDGEKLARSLQAHVSNIPSNARYRVERISEAYASRVSESIMTLHLDIRSEQAKLANLNEDEK